MSDHEESTNDRFGRTADLDDVLAQYAELEDAGQPVDVQAFIARYPQFAAELQDFFADAQLLEALPPALQAEPREWSSNSRKSGETIGRFTIRHELGRGGLGTVWRVHDPQLRRDVALKEIREEYARRTTSRIRFLREAQVTGQLEHPGIVPVYEVGRDDRDDRLFYAMRVIPGETLKEVIAEHHREWKQESPRHCRRLLEKFVTICDTLAYAHSRGVVHRDLKPHNVAIGKFGEVIVMDWGLAKVGEKDDAKAKEIEFGQEAIGQVSQVGRATGSPAYMAPEQAAGKIDEITSRTDVYGLGAILFELLTGSAPHRGPNSQAIIDAILTRETPSARERLATVPQALNAVCAKAMSRAPAERYSDAHALAADVRRWLDDEPVSVCPESFLRKLARWQRRHRSLVVVMTLCMLLIGSWAVWLTVERQRRFHDQLEVTNERLARELDDARFQIIFGDDAESAFDDCRHATDPSRLPASIEQLRELANHAEDINGQLADRIVERLVEFALLEAWNARRTAASNSLSSSNDATVKRILDRASVYGRAEYAIRLLQMDVRNDASNSEASKSDVLSPNETIDHIVAGELAREAGRLEQAIDEYRAALSREPNHFWAHLLIATCRLELGQASLAVESYDHAARLRPTYEWVYAARALALADMARWDDALADLEQAERIEPNFYGTFNNRGVLWYTRALVDEQATEAERRAMLIRSIEQFRLAQERNHRFPEAANNLALSARELARIDTNETSPDEATNWNKLAREQFSLAMSAGSQRYRPAVNLSLLEIHAGDLLASEQALNKATEDVDRMASHDPRRPTAARYLAWGKGWLEAARAEKALESSSAVRQPTAETLLQSTLKHWSQVIPESADRLHPSPATSNTSVHDLTMDSLGRDALVARARLRFKFFQALATQSETHGTTTLLVPLAADLDQLARLQKGALSGTDWGDVFAMRAAVRGYRQRNGDKLEGDSLADYSRALESNPDNSTIRLRRGWLLALAQPQAVREFDAALADAAQRRLEPRQRADAHVGRAYALALLGSIAPAVEDVETALRVTSDDWQILFNAAVVYALSADIAQRETKDIALAKRYGDKAIELLLRCRKIEFADAPDRWRQLIQQERGLIGIRDRDDFPSIAP